ncbi:MAG: sugar ABC transporter ATP-binding protein [Verrucomicrobia bacterium]|nr:sugar ABC transporter ATP-binding protein [Verrucomicrobiota bacterium]
MTEPVTNTSPLLSVRGIHKRFPGVYALKDVSLDVRRGEAHALVGENGAGKTTLMHILAGVHQPDEGVIEIHGHGRVTIPNERAAQHLGIAIVFQERSLFGPLSVAENVFAGRQPAGRWGKIDRRLLLENTRQLLRRVALHVEPQVPLEQLSPAQQQMVEIAKALSLNARLIIFDEPTAALTDTETRALFQVITQLKQQGVGIIYISHRLEEIFQIADRVTVLKDGLAQGTFSVAQTNPNDLVSRMVGREVALHQRHSDKVPGTNSLRLEVADLCDAEELRGSRPFLQQITFHARAGEIVVLAGLAGAGRTELALSLFGARPRGSGAIRIDGEPATIRSPADAIAAGLGYVPEDRKEAGLFLDMTIAQNVAAARLDQFGSRWWFNDRQSEATARAFGQRLRVVCQNVKQAVRNLSGGNQQKIVLAKWLLVNPKVLIVDEPTRGIDVGAKSEVHLLLHELSRKGAAVLVISSDLPEVLAVADRVLVLREGRIVGELNGSEATEEKVMRLASMSTPAGIQEGNAPNGGS